MKSVTPNPPSVGLLGSTAHFTANLPQIQEEQQEEEEDEDAMEMSDEDD